ncbi:uncharacterized protein LTR77_005760 [Saxophila tyrrhenica]|uniref:polynucleotide adenylyltransferase n=1 Tax=Saxophila tyrrhenica TaxID=1690608 RepID=A0AAV9PA07_9PEZI|nr:hypothetical protein LTR77_005760 [Saxophila tyrrhenica]
MGDSYHPQRERGYGQPTRYEAYPDRSRGYGGGDRYDPRYDNYSRYDPRPRSRSPSRYDPYARQAYAPPPRAPWHNEYEPYDDHRNANPPNSGYSFRGVAANGDTYQPTRAEENFSFRAPTGPSAPRFPPQQAPLPQRPTKAQRKVDGPKVQSQLYPPPQQRWKTGGFRKPPAPHQRDILKHAKRGGTPEQLEGMTSGGARFAEVISDDESDEDDAADDSDAPRKRQKVTSEPAGQEASAPKWSNPEYFTALPPPETAGAPKKDIVQVIRKAKREASSNQTSSNAVKSNVDYISFNFDDDVSMDGSDDMQIVDPPTGASKAAFDQSSRKHSNGGRLSNDNSLDQIHSAFDPQPLAARITKADDATGSPPKPPHGLIMPSDQELAATRSNTFKGKKRKHAEQSTELGSIIPAWQASGPSATPWFNPENVKTSSSALRLHMEICDFYDFVRPFEFEETVRQDLIERTQRAVRSSHIQPQTHKVEIKCFGSFASGLYLPTADMDLVAVSPDFLRSGMKTFCGSGGQIHRLARYLENTGLAAPGTVSPVPKARVPIVKFVESLTGIKVDISFENDSGLKANETFAKWKEAYPAMPIIVVLIKQMLAMRDLNEVFSGGLGGFSIICLVVNMMQLMPQMQSDSMDPQQHYGQLLLEFLHLYGTNFDTTATGIQMRPPYQFQKLKQKGVKTFSGDNQRLTIIDPNNPSNDISGGTRHIPVILDVFKKAHADIQRRLAEISSGKNVEESILGCVLGGNYDNFIQQRERLRNVSQGRTFGAMPSGPKYEPTAAKKNKAPQPPRRPIAVPHSKRQNGNAPNQHPPPPKPGKGAPGGNANAGANVAGGKKG